MLQYQARELLFFLYLSLSLIHTNLIFEPSSYWHHDSEAPYILWFKFSFASKILRPPSHFPCNKILKGLGPMNIKINWHRNIETKEHLIHNLNVMVQNKFQIQKTLN